MKINGVKISEQQKLTIKLLLKEAETKYTVEANNADDESDRYFANRTLHTIAVLENILGLDN